MTKSEKNFIKVNKSDGAMGFVLFVAWFGALVYFVQQSEGFWGVYTSIPKSLCLASFSRSPRLRSPRHLVVVPIC
jgi:hypothetical protein